MLNCYGPVWAPLCLASKKERNAHGVIANWNHPFRIEKKLIHPLLQTGKVFRFVFGLHPISSVTVECPRQIKLPYKRVILSPTFAYVFKLIACPLCFSYYQGVWVSRKSCYNYRRTIVNHKSLFTIPFTLLEKGLNPKFNSLQQSANSCPRRAENRRRECSRWKFQAASKTGESIGWFLYLSPLLWCL